MPNMAEPEFEKKYPYFLENSEFFFKIPKILINFIKFLEHSRKLRKFKKADENTWKFLNNLENPRMSKNSQY